MTPNHRRPSGRLLIAGMAAAILSGMIVSGCETVGGGESGAKRGPFTDPKRPKERPKFRSNIKCAAYASPQGTLDLDRLLDPLRPSIPGVETPAPDVDIVGGDGGGDRDRFPC